MARVPHRRRREEEDLEQVRQKQLDEQVMEKKLLLRQQFDQKEKSSKQQEGGQSSKIERQYRIILDGCFTRNLELRKRLTLSKKELMITQHQEKDEYMNTSKQIDWPQTSDDISQDRSIQKSQLSSRTLNVFSIQNLQKQLLQLRERHFQVENQMLLENQLTYSLLNMQDDITEVKTRLGKKVKELKSIHQVLRTHFENHSDVKDRYQQKEQEASLVLDQTKKQLQNLQIIEQAYTLKLVERGDSRKKAIEREESRIGHVQVRLEEARKQNEKSSKQVEDLTTSECQKKTRNNEFYYIGQYVALFEELEKFFIKGAPDDILVRYHILGEQQEQSKNLEQRENLYNKASRQLSITPQSPTSKQINNTGYKKLASFSQHSSRNDIINRFMMSQRERRLCEIFLNNCNIELYSGIHQNANKKMKDSEKSLDNRVFLSERLEIVQHVDQFYEVHQQGPNHLVDLALKIYSQLQVQQNSLQSTYQEKSHETGDKKRMYEFLIHQCDNLMVQYNQVVKIENDPEYNENFDNSRVALDSGMIKVVKNEQNLDQKREIFIVNFDEQLEADLTTINKVRFQGTECSYENSMIQHEFKLNEFFILNIFTYITELLQRLCYIVVWLSEYTQMVPVDLDHRCISVLKRISNKDLSLWIPSYNQSNTQQQQTHNDTKQNFLQIFQQQTQKLEKRGSFVNILNRKKSHPVFKQSPLSIPQTVTQSTASLLNNGQFQQQLVIPLNQITIQKLPNQKLGSFLKQLNHASSFNEDNSSETFKCTLQQSENIQNDELSTQNNLVEYFLQRFKNFPKATEEWKDLTRNDNLSSYFIKQDQSLNIIENLNRKLDKCQGDNIGLISLIYDSFEQVVFSGSQSLQDLLEFIFQNYREIVRDVTEMSRLTMDDIKELQHEKERELGSNQTLRLKKNTTVFNPKVLGNNFLKDMSQKANQKQKNYLNSSEDPSTQIISIDRNHRDDDEKKYHLQFILDSNNIQRKNTVLHQKLIGQALQDIDNKKKLEMLDDYCLHQNEGNHISDNDYLDTERKHLKHIINNNQIEIQRQQNGLALNKQSNSQINAACIDRFFVDINNFETQQIKSIYKSASLLHKITNLELMNLSSDRLNIKSKLVDDQKSLAKKFHRETKKISTTYDKPNQLYQLRMQINIPEFNQIKERKNRSLIQRLKKKKTQKASSLESPLRLPKLETSQLGKNNVAIVQYNSGLEIEEEPPSQVTIQHQTSVKFDPKKQFSKFKKQLSTSQNNTERSIQVQPNKSPQQDSLVDNYFDMEHQMMNHHLDQSLSRLKEQKCLLIDKEAANNYGFNSLKF